MKFGERNKTAKHLKFISLSKGKVLVLDFFRMSYTHKAQRVLSELRTILHDCKIHQNFVISKHMPF